jgi:hypothetical protein
MRKDQEESAQSMTRRTIEKKEGMVQGDARLETLRGRMNAAREETHPEKDYAGT